MQRIRKSGLRTTIKYFLECCKTKDDTKIFKNDKLALRFAKDMGKAKNPRRQFERYNFVPQAFINYLIASEPLLKEVNFPTKKMTVEELEDLLDGFYKPLLQKKYPMLKKSLGSSEWVWEKLEAG